MSFLVHFEAVFLTINREPAGDHIKVSQGRGFGTELSQMGQRDRSL